MRLAILMSVAGPWQRDTAIRLAELGHSVHVIGLDIPRGQQHYLSVADPFQVASIERLERSVEGVHVVETNSSAGTRYFTSAPKLRKVLRRIDVDALLTLYGGGQATMAQMSGFRPYSVYAVGSDILLLRFMRRRLGRMALHAARHVFVNGAYLAQRTRQLAPRARITPVYLGVDTALFHPAEPAPEPVHIVCTRGFAPIYNNEFLIQGLAALPPMDTDFRVTFVAGGPMLEQARAMADRILPGSIHDRVTFLGGASRDELAEVLKTAHVYVSVSRSDGTSVSLMEALACGLFPILSDIPPNREWIQADTGNGVLVPLNDINRLASALARAVKDAPWRTAARSYNLQLAADRADARRNMARLASMLEADMRTDAH